MGARTADAAWRAGDCVLEGCGGPDREGDGVEGDGMEVWGMTSVSAGAHNQETRECVEEEVLAVDARTVWI